MNIVICGLTASGKTTHALLLASRLGYDYFSASNLMLARLGLEGERNNSTWTTRMREIEQLRDERPTDEEVNLILRNEFERRSHTVFDSWAGPWLASGPCVRIWIESTIDSRAWKARVSQEPYGPFLSIEECKALLTDKDNSTADRLFPLLGVDIRIDRSVFDVIVDNSDMISAPTIAAARKGIGYFHEILINQVVTRLQYHAHDARPRAEDEPVY